MTDALKKEPPTPRVFESGLLNVHASNEALSQTLIYFPIYLGGLSAPNSGVVRAHLQSFLRIDQTNSHNEP